MPTLESNNLVFRFPELGEQAAVTLSLIRTLRIPDDGREYPLPAGLGQFPLLHVDDYADGVPAHWLKRGGVFMPMYQSEAVWISFGSGWRNGVPCAIKIAAGKVNAVTGAPWTEALSADPQDYLVVPTQPWLDGFCVEKGVIRQFVAMPLGLGVTAEEQLTGEAKYGGLQIMVCPMKPDRYREYLDQRRRWTTAPWLDLNCCEEQLSMRDAVICEQPEMGLAPGGRMRQEVYEDAFGIDAWDQSEPARCFVHLLNSMQYKTVTGQRPPTKPITQDQYRSSGIPWFEYYGADAKALEGSATLSGLKSVGESLGS